MEQRVVPFAHELAEFERRRAPRRLRPGLPQQILQFLSVVLRTVWDVNVAILRRALIGVLLLLPMYFLAWL